MRWFYSYHPIAYRHSLCTEAMNASKSFLGSVHCNSVDLSWLFLSFRLQSMASGRARRHVSSFPNEHRITSIRRREIELCVILAWDVRATAETFAPSYSCPCALGRAAFPHVPHLTLCPVLSAHPSSPRFSSEICSFQRSLTVHGIEIAPCLRTTPSAILPPS